MVGFEPLVVRLQGIILLTKVGHVDTL